MEDNSQAVVEGKIIGASTYQRRSQRWCELDLGRLKIDHFDPMTNTVREIKKSPKLEHSHIAQVKYYLYALQQRGVEGASGLIEYPKQRKTTVVELTEADHEQIKSWEVEIERIVKMPECPLLVTKAYCKNCAFRDFCFI